ncbi:S66 peptidase family protein [Bacillus sp. FJAT-49736]|uniref:S66 family peptidase n=1 Tax=Bacillus sp. FJAT-49736 TaxID=2833582 RepID=UPI001BCA4180|nr:S66 peptidase family protein [Bacillus sp. FJAT-49736]MBS4174707.1 LD-carboxypeptidase [Bacillus sp. FJAT-49736]
MKKSILYPKNLTKGDTIAVSAPSSGVEEPWHRYIKDAQRNVEKLGFKVIIGDTVWTNEKCVSASKEIRARELQQFLLDDQVKAIIPPWGGEFLMDLLPFLDWGKLRSNTPKWILGYSDISTFTFAYTLLTGIATAHGNNFFDLSANKLDSLTQKWLDVLGNPPGETISQTSSSLHISSWGDDPNSGFQLDTQTVWKSLISTESTQFSGRLLGGCLDTISILIGTPYAPVQQYVEKYCQEEGVIWFLESCEMNAADIYRHLWQMKMNGWFEKANGVLIGRPAGYSDTKDFTLVDALHMVFGDMDIPVIYDADIGHVPPQMILVNGAKANVSYTQGSGTADLTFM